LGECLACQFLARNGSSAAIWSENSAAVVPVSGASCQMSEVAAVSVLGLSHGASV
jgi:hypothetical protein